MGVYERDSPYWWAWIEGSNPPIRFSTKIPIGNKHARTQSRADAEEIYRAAMGDVARGVFKLPNAKPSRTFRQHAEWYRDNVTSTHRGKGRESSVVNILITAFGDLALDAITGDGIEDWKLARVKVRKPSTVNRELEVLKPILASAVPKYLDENPAADVRKFRVRLPPIAILSESAEDALLKAASPAERAFVLLGLDALLRLGDVRRLHTDHDHGATLSIVDPKTEPYKVPVSARLRAALDALEPKDGYYFPRWYRKRWAPISAPRAFWLFRALCERAGVPTGRKQGGITFHGLRHTGATRAARVVKLTVVQRLGGWKNLAQLARYDHPEDAEIVRAVEAIGSRPAHAPIARVKNKRKTG